jgi:hypothetical protein
MIAIPADSPLQALGDAPAMVIFLRSFGCTFCREAMADVAKLKDSIRASGIQIAFVHSASPAEAAPWFHKYGLDDVTQVSDPGLAHYRAFGLEQKALPTIVNPKVWTRGAASALAHGFGSQTVDELRLMPGVFVVQHGRVLAEYRHTTPADRPDYLALIRGVQ